MGKLFIQIKVEKLCLTLKSKQKLRLNNKKKFYFAEIEARDEKEEIGLDFLTEQCDKLMKDFGIEKEQLLTCSYSDMLKNELPPMRTVPLSEKEFKLLTEYPQGIKPNDLQIELDAMQLERRDEMASLEIGESVFIVKKILLPKGIGWGLYELHLVSIGSKYCFVQSTLPFEEFRIFRLEKDLLFTTKKEAMEKIPEDCKNFEDYTVTRLPPVENNKLSVKEKIAVAKFGG